MVCPTCNKTEFSIFPNKGLQRSLYEFHVHCSHKKEGCQWTGELGELEKHLNENPILGRQFTGCEFTEIKCNGCRKSFQRQHFKAHQLEEHLFTCEYCHSYDSYYEDVVINHWPVCGFYPVPCPNNCGENHERQNLKQHVSNNCHFSVVRCNFHYVGCEVKLPRKDMPAHLAENLVPHMAQLATYNQKKVEEKDQQITQLTEDLRQRIDHLERKNEALSRSLQEKDEEIVQLQKTLCVKDKAIAEEFTQLREDTCAKEESLKEEITQLWQKQKGSVLKEENEALKQEINQLQEAAREKDMETRQEIENLKQKWQESEDRMISQLKKVQEEACKIEELKQDDAADSEIQLKAKQEDQSSQQTLQSYVGPPTDFKMPKFQEHKDSGQSWHSEPFYTHPYGYKMCLRVDANGNGKGEDTHVSVFISLMQGKFDDHLRWPFQGEITIQLLNQLAKDEGHLTHTLSYSAVNDSKIISRVTSCSAPTGFGEQLFLHHSQLGHDVLNNCHFLKDDCLYFRVTRVTNVDWPSLERQCLAIASRVCVPPFKFTMSDFEQHKANNDIWYSPSFYTHQRGYRMCLRADANGFGTGKDTHVSVFIHLMKGEWDNYLKWPFRGDITIQLLNQLEDKEHYEMTLDFSICIPGVYTAKVTTGERARGWGWFQFINNRRLNYKAAKNCQYLKHNSLHFQIIEVQLKSR